MSRLALLDHPNIAQVYDAGTTKHGRPYLVHAHQKGIIHRDIKPSNILVAIEGRRAIPKLIDFGVAKALTQPLTERTLFTEEGRLIGTPEYMSPEQAAMTAQDIDTRSDIYSLGVLLYELLAGAVPFERKTLERGGLAELQRIIREQAPPHPSLRLSSLGEEGETIAANRRTDVVSLARLLRKELEWIPLKAMRKERTHRYRSVSEVADDIQHYLNEEPLIAGPESAAYRVRKFLGRHRELVASIAAVLVVFVAGVVISMHFALGRARAAAEVRVLQEMSIIFLDRIAENQAKLRQLEEDTAFLIDPLTPIESGIGAATSAMVAFPGQYASGCDQQAKNSCSARLPSFLRI